MSNRNSFDNSTFAILRRAEAEARYVIEHRRDLSRLERAELAIRLLKQAAREVERVTPWGDGKNHHS